MWATQVAKAPLDSQVPEVQQASLARKALRVILDLQVARVTLDLLEARALLVAKVILVTLVQLDSQAVQEQQEHKAPLASLAHRATLVLREQLALLVV